MTHDQILRMNGSYPLRNGRRVYSEVAFKKAFRVGDLIHYGLRGTGRITAIGETRFLFSIAFSGGTVERTGTIRNPRGWGKP